MISQILNNLISMKDAAECSGYSPQYMRLLIQTDNLAGLKLGQQWFIEIESFGSYLDKVEKSHDNRFGPKKRTQNSDI